MSKVYKTTNRNSGFSLLETVVVLIVSSLLISSVALLGSQYIKQEKLARTAQSIQDSKTQISYSFSTQLAFSCPADRSLSPSDPNYLREFDPDCNVSILSLSSGCSPNPGQSGGNTCWGCTDGGGLCVVPGARDIDVSGVIGDDIREFVVIGGIPIRSIRSMNETSFSDEIILDGYDTQLTYAVSAGQAIDGQYKFYEGAIDVVDEQGNATAGINNDAHYVIISHGKNKAGGFSKDGTMRMTCGADTDSVDFENCDADSTFVQGITSEAVGVTYFDDSVTIVRQSASKVWDTVGNTNHIYNLNQENVGIKTETPDKRLTVAGNVTSEGNVRANFICADIEDTPDNPSDDVCLDANIFTSGIDCPDGKYITQVDLSLYDPSDGMDPTEAEAVLGCEDIGFPQMASGNCPTGQFVTGIQANGQPICEVAPFLDQPSPPPPTYYYYGSGSFGGLDGQMGFCGGGSGGIPMDGVLDLPSGHNDCSH